MSNPPGECSKCLTMTIRGSMTILGGRCGLTMHVCSRCAWTLYLRAVRAAKQAARPRTSTSSSPLNARPMRAHIAAKCDTLSCSEGRLRVLCLCLLYTGLWLHVYGSPDAAPRRRAQRARVRAAPDSVREPGMNQALHASVNYQRADLHSVIAFC